MDLIRAHPYFAAGSFVASGTVAGGLAHHFLDLDTPYAVGAGVATGAAVVAAEGYAYAEYAAFKNWLTGWMGAAGAAATAGVEAVADEGAKVGNTLEDWGDTLGINGDHIDLDKVIKSGTPEEKALAAEIQKLIASWMFRKPTTEEVQHYTQLAARLRYMLDHGGADVPDGTDARFTSNHENPPATSKPPIEQEKPDADLEKEEAQWDLAHPDEVAAAAAANGSGSFEQSKEAFEQRQKQDPLANAPPGFRRY